MQNEREALLEALLEGYSGYFDVAREEALDGMLKAMASYHNYMEKYVLVRKAQLWAAHAHEFIFLFSLPHLDMANWERIRDFFLEKGLALAPVDKQHMYTYITPVLLADTIDADVKRAMKRYSFYKSFKLSFYGWTTVRLCALETDTGKILTNYQGKDVGKFVNKTYQKEKTV